MPQKILYYRTLLKLSQQKLGQLICKALGKPNRENSYYVQVCHWETGKRNPSDACKKALEAVFLQELQSGLKNYADALREFDLN